MFSANTSDVGAVFDYHTGRAADLAFEKMATALHRPNVLYAVSHDLRHDVASSALDSIVSDSGCRFTMAFAQAPYCAPSRNSFFTGRRTTATGVHTFDAHDAVREL